MLHMVPNTRILTKVIRTEKRENRRPSKDRQTEQGKGKAWSREETWPATLRGTSRGENGSGKKKSAHGIPWRVESRVGLLLYK